MSAIDPALVDEWRGAIGREQRGYQRLEAESLRRYALAVGSTPDVEKCLPPLAHWAFFLPGAQDDDIGPDGHPRRGGFLPAISLPRRMFATSVIRFEGPLLIAEDAVRVSRIADVSYKNGRSGALIFVEVDHMISQQGTVRIAERQSYVYRGDGGPVPMPVATNDVANGTVWHPDEVHLFRFSAATFNSHRIHYDLPYARDIEGYPALVVHGPFTAAKLATLAARRGPLASFSFRAHAPLFLGQPIWLQADDNEVRAMRCDGAVAMTASVTYR